MSDDGPLWDFASLGLDVGQLAALHAANSSQSLLPAGTIPAATLLAARDVAAEQGREHQANVLNLHLQACEPAPGAMIAAVLGTAATASPDAAPEVAH